MNLDTYLQVLDQQEAEKRETRRRADELLRINRANQVEYPTGENFNPLTLVGKGLYQWLKDDNELNGDMGTPGLKEGAQFAMMAPLMAIPGALGAGALTRGLTGAALNVGAGLPFYMTDSDNADPLMDAAMGLGMGMGGTAGRGIAGMLTGGFLGWSPESESGLLDDLPPSTWAPYNEMPSGLRGPKYAGGGLVKNHSNNVLDIITQCGGKHAQQD